MALILMDGFDCAPVVKNGMTTSGATSAAGRDGIGKSINAATITIPFASPLTTLIVGFGYKPSAGVCPMLATYSDAGATYHVFVGLDALGHVELRRGATNGAVIATSTLLVTALVWHYFEVKATIADSGGTFIVKVDGVTYINFTGDTKNAGTLSTFSNIMFYAGASNGPLDDLVVMDATGADHNDFIGERVIRPARPIGAGASTGLTPSSAVANWTTVDEDPWSPTVDYVAGTTGTDTYDCTSVSGLQSVEAVQVHAYSLKTDSGARTLRTVMRSTTPTVVESADLTLSTTISVVSGAIRQTNPDGAAWTQALVNSAEYGVKVT